MAIDLNDEIVQDFLIEAGEILEKLGEQLMELESQPGDTELLNAVFRGFHTIKGGAGFLGVDAVVDVCHRAEDTFNLLRQGVRVVDTEVMDPMLAVLDDLNLMFDAMRAGTDPLLAAPELLATLEKLAQPPESSAAGPQPSTEPAAPPSEVFEELLETLDDSEPPVSSAGETISDEEFESFLDDLHGVGGAPGSGVVSPVPSDDISEDDFENLLNEIHGEGKAPGTPNDENASAVSSAVSTQAQDAPPVETSTPEVAGNLALTAEPAEAPKTAPAKSSKGGSGDSTVRVDTAVLNRIMNMVGELVLVRNRLATLESTLADEEMTNAVGNLDVVTTDLQAAAMRTRMQPIKKVFGRFPRVVRDLARSLDKELELVMQGEDTELDKNLVDALADPMIHLVRNAADHGLESPDERIAAGKPRKGTVLLSAEQQGDQIMLSVSDDGKGIDADVLRQKMVEKGMMDELSAQRLDEQACYNMIFAPGFSTKGEISDVSGRGVGMDVVKNRISELNGSVHIDSRIGKGTNVVIKVPLTLAIVPTLMVKLTDRVFALPLINVKEVFELEEQRTNVVDGQPTVLVRGQPLPLFYLSRWLVNPRLELPTKDAHVVVLHVGNQMVAFVVDHLIGQEEVVIKPLGALLKGTKGLAGATITGDGQIALILDVPELISRYARAA